MKLPISPCFCKLCQVSIPKRYSGSLKLGRRSPRKVQPVAFQSLKGILAHWNASTSEGVSGCDSVSIPKRYSGSLKPLVIFDEIAFAHQFQSLKGILAHWNYSLLAQTITGDWFQSLKGILAHWNRRVSPAFASALKFQSLKGILAHWNLVQLRIWDWGELVSIPKRYSGSLKLEARSVMIGACQVSIPKRYSGSLKQLKLWGRCHRKNCFNP